MTGARPLKQGRAVCVGVCVCLWICTYITSSPSSAHISSTLFCVCRESSLYEWITVEQLCVCVCVWQTGRCVLVMLVVFFSGSYGACHSTLCVVLLHELFWQKQTFVVWVMPLSSFSKFTSMNQITQRTQLWHAFKNRISHKAVNRIYSLNLNIENN